MIAIPISMIKRLYHKKIIQQKDRNYLKIWSDKINAHIRSNS